MQWRGLAGGPGPQASRVPYQKLEVCPPQAGLQGAASLITAVFDAVFHEAFGHRLGLGCQLQQGH